MKFRIYLKLAACLALPLIVGFISGIATADSVDGWYATIVKPSFNPPNLIFPIVWTLLYLLMGMSLFIVLQTPRSKPRKGAVTAFAIQLALNFLWSFVFFYFHQIGLSLVNIILLWLAILWMIYSFSRLSKFAAYLQVPYLLWVSFASVLNATIYLLN